MPFPESDRSVSALGPGVHARADLLRETKDQSSISVHLVSDRLSHFRGPHQIVIQSWI
jgi:hypothetical protein